MVEALMALRVAGLLAWSLRLRQAVALPVQRSPNVANPLPRPRLQRVNSFVIVSRNLLHIASGWSASSSTPFGVDGCN